MKTHTQHAWRALFDNPFQAVVLHRYVFDDRRQVVDLLFEDANQAAEPITGVRRADLIGRTFTDVFGHELLARYLPLIAKMRETRAAINDSAPERYPRSSDRYFSTCLLPVDDEHFLVVHADVTVLVHTERDGDQFRDFHAAILSKVSDGICVTDASDRLIYVNSAMEKIAGAKAADLLGLNITTEFPPETTATFLEHYHRAKLERRDVHFEADVVTPAGRPTVQSGWLTPRCSGDEFLGMVCTIQDITEQRSMEEALRCSEEQYRSLFDQMLDAFAVHEMMYDERGKPADYRFLSVNPAFETMTGLKAKDVVGRTVMEVLPGTEPRWVETYARVVATGRPVVFEDYTQALDRHYFVTAYRPAPGQFACIFIDISERKRTEEALRRSEEQLRQAQKMEAVGRLAGGIAHDFNNLLAAILGYTHLLLADPACADDSVQADLEEVRQAGERAALLTQQILAFSRRQTLRPAIVSLNQVVANVEPLLRRTLREDIDLEIDMDSDLALVEADVHQFERVVMNLAVNARDAMRDGGRLTISTRNVHLDKAFCAGHLGAHPGRYVELAVTDTGAGMDQETRDHIFEPFFTTKPTGEGTGLGLSMVYGIVKQSQGNVYVESEPGRGTSFSVYLPSMALAEVKNPALAAQHASPTGTETVLLVEDEAAVRNLVGRVLSDLGYQVLSAANGLEALQQVQEHLGELHLLLIDVVLPRGMQGTDLARELTTMRPGLPVLFMSGYARDAMISAGRLDDEMTLVQKPFSPDAIARAVRNILDGVSAA